jgi:hypothetical protein
MKIFIILLFIILTNSLYSQKKKTYTTQRLNSEIKVDGILDDVAWQNGQWEGNFIQRKPNDGAKATQQTFFKIFYTNKYIFVAIRALENNPDSIDKRLVRRDNQEGDMVGINFDSYYDKRTAFSFFVNAAGVKSDIIYSSGGNEEDKNWNPIWWVKTSINSEGWSAEMKIPLSQLRFSKDENKVWGLEVSRYINRLGELSLWQPIPRTEASWVYNFGELHGINGINPHRIMELAPYATLGLETSEKEDGNPYATGSKLLYGAGIDGKIGITNDFVLDFTFNPDFGQVEADPSEVNLTAFESYFPEQRPFFVEGSNITNYKISSSGGESARDNLFYSRRIGRSPQYYPDLQTNEYMDYPFASKIIGAMKITGKTKDGFSLGIVESVTREEFADISKNGEEREVSVEPLTNYFVARAQQDFKQGNTIIGGEITSTTRNINNASLLFLPKQATTAGADFAQYWDNQKYFLKVRAAYSNISGDSLSIIERQTAPQRYYQRPDADYVNVDSSLTSLSGYGGNFTMGKEVESGWNYSINVLWRSPGISLNDIGYLRNADKVLQVAKLEYKWTKPTNLYRSIELGGAQWNGWNFGGNTLFHGGMIWWNTQFKNYYNLVVRGSTDMDVHDNFKLRGGPSFFQPGNISFRINLESNTSKRFYADFGTRQTFGQYSHTRKNAWDAGFTYRPFDALSLAFHPNISQSYNDLQYVEETSFNGNPRYILARIEQTTLHLRFYVDYNISPDLTIQYFGSPFISSGGYSDYKMVDQPSATTYTNRFHQYSTNEISYNENTGSFDIDENNDGTTDYSFNKPDFNFKQFQSNLVLRWEFTPGSMIYLVWTQNKTNYDGLGTFNFSNDMDNLFSTIPKNVFLIKFSYRFMN